jgi:hypothetical protein
LAYEASLIKRKRRTAVEIAVIEQAMYRILEEVHPRTGRNVFYLVSGQGLVQKTENEYNNTIIRLLTWMRKPNTYNSIEDALLNAARTYRRSVWQNVDAHVEIWTEKDAIASIMYQETSVWDVPLFAGRGYASHTYLYNTAEYIREIGKPAYIYYFGDYDPRGLDISRFVEEHIREYAEGIEITFERVGVTREQIDRWQLPTRPTKKEKSGFGKHFDAESVDIDTIDPRDLRALVRDCITRHIHERDLEVLRLAENEERTLFYDVVRRMAGRR